MDFVCRWELVKDNRRRQYGFEDDELDEDSTHTLLFMNRIML